MRKWKDWKIDFIPVLVRIRKERKKEAAIQNISVKERGFKKYK